MKQFSSETGCSKTFIQGLIILFFRPYWHAFHDMIIMMIGFKHFWIRLKYLILAFPNFELAGYVFCFWPNLARDMELFVRWGFEIYFCFLNPPKRTARPPQTNFRKKLFWSYFVLFFAFFGHFAAAVQEKDARPWNFVFSVNQQALRCMAHMNFVQFRSFRAHFVNQILAANAGSKIFSKSLGFAGFEPW